VDGALDDARAVALMVDGNAIRAVPAAILAFPTVAAIVIRQGGKRDCQQNARCNDM